MRRAVFNSSPRLTCLLVTLACSGGSSTTNLPAPPANPSISTVSVQPVSHTFAALGDTQQLTAEARDAQNNVVSTSFTWTSSDSSIVAVSLSGLATANANGSTSITATSSGKSDSANVAVQQQAATVVITPPASTIGVGDTVRFSAAADDANGNALSGAGLLWSSDSVLIATIDQSGLVTGVSTGVTQVTVSTGAVSDTADVTVSSNPPQATIFFTEDFEDVNFGSRGFYDNTSLTITSAEAHSGSSSLEVMFVQGATNPAWGLGTRHLFTETESVYLSYWVKYSTNWVGSGQSFHPHEFYFFTSEDGQFVSPAFNRLTAYVEHNYQSGGIPVLALQDAANIDVANVNVDLTGITETRSVAGCNGDTDGFVTSCFAQGGGLYNNTKRWIANQPTFTDAPGVGFKNDWHFVEAFFQLNSIQNGIGLTDGIVRYWFDGTLVIEHQNVLLRTGAHPTMKFNQFLIGPFIGVGSPTTQTAWFDEVRVADRRP